MENLFPFISNMEELKKSGFLKAEKGNYYLSFKVPKSSGGWRWIDAPQEPLISVQKDILYNLLYKVKPHPCCIGFRRNMSVKDGAKRHFGNKCLLNMDLKNFFPSVKSRHLIPLFYRISNILARQGYPKFTKKEVKFLCSVCLMSGRMPQGSPASPALANLVSYSMDFHIAEACKDLGITYTRYADDMSFSHPDKDFDIKPLIPVVTTIAESNYFKINKKKTRVARPHQQMNVTGIVINDRLSVPRKKWRNFRAKLHNLIRDGKTITEKEYQKLSGYIEWIRQVHPKKAKKFQDQLGQIPIRED